MSRAGQIVFVEVVIMVGFFFFLFLHFFFFFTGLKGWVTQRKRERERERVCQRESHLLVSQMAAMAAVAGADRSKEHYPGLQHWWQGPKHLDFFCCLLRHVRRELDCKQSSLNLNLLCHHTSPPVISVVLGDGVLKYLPGLACSPRHLWDVLLPLQAEGWCKGSDTELFTWKLDTERSSFYWFIPQMPATARAVSDGSQEPGTASRPPTCWAGAQVFEPSSAVLPGTATGSQIRSRTAWPWLGERCSMQ